MPSPLTTPQPQSSPADGNRGFGIYIHWPYCLSKCPYCDFFSIIKKNVNQNEIIDGYLEDLDFYQNLTNGRTVTSIFFGGGTPSLIAPQNIEKIISRISKNWKIAPNAEISLEANPNTNHGTMFKDLKHAGINRLSLGIQALNDKDLKFLGRTHNLSQALNSIEDVLNNFDNHSMDLIYARPEQTAENWQKELEQAAGLGFRHLSFYQLTIEEETFFHKKGIEPADENTAAALYLQTNKALSSFGYRQYEVSNYAQTGFESSHNKLYWEGDDYLGIGPAAHGRIHAENKFYATTYRRQTETLTPAERATELVIMGLRLKQGIDKHVFKHNCGIAFDEFINRRHLDNLLGEELIINDEHKLQATDKGFLVLNKIIEELCS